MMSTQTKFKVRHNKIKKLAQVKGWTIGGPKTSPESSGKQRYVLNGKYPSGSPHRVELAGNANLTFLQLLQGPGEERGNR